MKLYEITGSKFPTTREEVANILYDYRIYSYIINDDLTVNINGNISLANYKFSHFPVKFGTVSGNFNCSDNSSLLSLEGAPTSLTGSFICTYCPNITALEGIGEVLSGAKGLLYFTWEYIDKGGLGFLQTEASRLAEISTAPFKIINKYMKRKDDIFECQSELIEAGYEDYAIL